MMDGHDLVEFREQPPHVLGSHDDVEFSGPRGLVARSFKRLELHVRTSVSAFASKMCIRDRFKSGVLEKLGFDPLVHFEEPNFSPYSCDAEYLEKYPVILIAGNRAQPFYHSEFRQIPAMRDPVSYTHLATPPHE